VGGVSQRTECRRAIAATWLLRQQGQKGKLLAIDKELSVSGGSGYSFLKDSDRQRVWRGVTFSNRPSNVCSFSRKNNSPSAGKNFRMSLSARTETNTNRWPHCVAERGQVQTFCTLVPICRLQISLADGSRRFECVCLIAGMASPIRLARKRASRFDNILFDRDLFQHR
jgi:hypothetical protein